MKGLFSNRHGQSLIECLIVIGLVALVSLAMATMIAVQNHEIRRLTEKGAVLDLQSSLTSVLSDGSVCTYGLTTSGPWLGPGVTAPVTFDAANLGGPNAPTIPLNQILSGAAVGSPPLITVGSPILPNFSSPIVQSIQITNINGFPTGSQFWATIQVVLNPSSLLQALKPITAQIALKTSTSGTVQTVVSCGSTNQSGFQTIVGGSACVPLWGGFTCGGWNSWGDWPCPANTTQVPTSAVSTGYSGYLCLRN